MVPEGARRAIGLSAQALDEPVHRLPDCVVEFGSGSSQGANGAPVVDPEHGACGEPHEIKKARPNHPEGFVRERKTVFVKRDMTGFIPNDQATHLGDGGVAWTAVFEHELVVSIADDLGEQEGAEFKGDTHDLPDFAED